jgi:hypothetical protein
MCQAERRSLTLADGRADEKSNIWSNARENLKERSRNVYENKGTLWKTPGPSRNVIENKGTYSYFKCIVLKATALQNAIAGRSSELGSEGDCLKRGRAARLPGELSVEGGELLGVPDAGQMQRVGEGKTKFSALLPTPRTRSDSGTTTWLFAGWQVQRSRRVLVIAFSTSA